MNIPIKTITRADLKAMRGTVKRGRSKVLEDKFDLMWKSQQPYQLVREFRFCLTRRWKFDFAHLATKVAVEIQGGGFKPKNYHGSGAGMEKDCEKFLDAAYLGWQVITITGKMIHFSALSKISSVIRQRLPKNALPPLLPPPPEARQAAC